MSALPHGDPAAIPSGTVTFVFTDIEGVSRYASAALARIGYKREFTEDATYRRLSASLARFAPVEVARYAERGAAITAEAAIALTREPNRVRVLSGDGTGT